jgi:hypothetical protein
MLASNGAGTAAARIVNAADAAGISASNDDKVTLSPGSRGRTNLCGHRGRLDELLARKVAAALGKLLVFQMNPGHAR